MKKTLFITILAGVCALANAQQQMPAAHFPGHSQQFLESLSNARRMGQDVYVDDTDIEVHQDAPAAERITTQDIGYLNPAGTLFLGMDEGGKGTFFKNPGVIGAWSDSIPCWKWLNQRTAYKSVKYLTAFSKAHPSYCEDANYGIDLYGNFCDTILASGGYQDAYAMDAAGDEGYYWQHATPHQTTKYNDGSEKVYMMLSNASKPSADKCPLAAGGLPSSNTSDGLWPLTNAVNISRAGTSVELLAYTAEDGYVHYLFGSSKYTVDSFATQGVIEQDSMVYERYAPVKLTTRYDKPQAPLYIKSVTMMLCSDQYSASNQGDLKFDTLFLSIQDQNGHELAHSYATTANLSSMTYKKGKVLTFNFRDTTAYGEVLREGLLVSDAFQLTLTGFNETDNFGIYAAVCSVHPTKTEMLYEGGVTKSIAYEPYIMLNGIYPTLEDYYTGSDRIETGQVGDTIPVNMVSYHAYGYQYIASYAKLGEDVNEFAFYSTFTPYDSGKRTWNFDIEQPDYIQMVADYEYNISGDDDDPITLWSYYRLFTLYVYATETPKIGDCIKFGKAGKYIILRIDEINGVTALDELTAGTKAEKIVRDGQVLIRKNGRTYNTLGQVIR